MKHHLVDLEFVHEIRSGFLKALIEGRDMYL